MVARAQSDVDQATSGASGAAVGSDQQTAGSTGGTFSETGHKASTDVAVEEAISQNSSSQSNYSQLSVQRALRSQDVLDNLTNQLLQNAIETANMLSKQAVRHADLATDRIWNVNETDAYSVAAIKAIAEIVRQG
jgi:ribosome assembly protein YihI (activator of Der GTPase)